VIGLHVEGHDNSSPSTRQSWHARSVHRYSRWRLWFYLRGRLRHYTFTWISKTNDASLRSCRLTPSWKVYTLLAERASLLTRNEPGQYRALQWNEGEQKYKENLQLGVLVEVTVCISYPLTLYLRHQKNKTELTSERSMAAFYLFKEMNHDNSLVNTRGPTTGRFTFTSHDSGDHTICLSPSYPDSAWFSTSSHIRMHLDIAIGKARADLSHDRSHVSELASKVRELNVKLEDIRREQQYQRERETDFRNLSETANSRAVWYSVAQIVVLIVTCVWQLRHLRVSFP